MPIGFKTETNPKATKWFARLCVVALLLLSGCGIMRFDRSGQGTSSSSAPTDFQLSIQSGAAYTNTLTIQLQLSGLAQPATSMAIFDGAGCAGTASWQAYSASTAYTLTGTNGLKSISAKVKSDSWESSCQSGAITLDTIPPATPVVVLSDPGTSSTTQTNAGNPTLTITGDTDAIAWCVKEQSASAGAPAAPATTDACWLAVRPNGALLATFGSRQVYVYTQDIAGNISTSAATASISYLPSITVAATAANEGSDLNFNVTLSSASSSAVSFAYATADGTAIAGTNYTQATGIVTIAAGQTTGTLTIHSLHDNVFNADLNFNLSFSSPSQAYLTSSTVTGTVRNTDAQPSVAIAAASSQEGTALVFTLTQSVANGAATSINWATSDGTAVAGVDYTASSGTALITPGQTTTTITVPTLYNQPNQASKTVLIRLSNPLNATLTTATATGTITSLALYLDFTTLTVPTAASFTRASTAIYRDNTGTFNAAAVDTPRFEYSTTTSLLQGLMMESASTNAVTNSTITGGTTGVIGSGGAVPTNWVAVLASGITLSLVAKGTENGLNYADLRFNGTNNTGASVFPAVSFEKYQNIAAAQNDTWSVSYYAKLVSGSIGTGVFPRLTLVEENSAGSFLVSQDNPIGLTSSLQRFSFTRQLTNASTAHLQPRISITVPNSTTIDFTIRVYAPQLEKSSLTTAPIPTSTAAVTRAADQLHVTIPDGTYNIRIATTYVSYDLSNVSVSGGTGWSFAWPAAAQTAQQRYVKSIMFATSSLPANSQLLLYHPPSQTSPTTVIATQGQTYYGPYTATQDITFVLPSYPLTNAVQIDGGRNVRVIGGFIQPTTAAGHVLFFNHVTGSVYVEGVTLDGQIGQSDGLDVSGQTGYTPDVYIQNTRILNLSGAYTQLHADIFQPQGPMGNLYIYQLTGTSNYQGITIPPQSPITSATLNKINLSYLPNALNAYTYLLWFRDDCTQTAFPITLDQVYVNPRSGQDVLTYGAWPNPTQTGCGSMQSNGNIYWPAQDLTSGFVYSGTPSGGDFAPDGNIGENYISPGYQ